jgi:hypothetical protein
MSSSAVQGPLVDAIVVLASMPDDNSTALDDCLQHIVKLTVTSTASVDYASVTARRKGALTTVAMSNALALAVDEAQYADDNGPCLDALAAGIPIRSDIATTINWPRFRDDAASLGLSASLSIPLFAGRGRIIAALNLYARNARSLDQLTEAILHVYEFHESDVLPRLDQFDRGAAELVCGMVGAFSVQQRIQVAIGLLIHSHQLSEADAYLELREHAALTQTSLLEAADDVTSKFSPR